MIKKYQVLIQIWYLTNQNIFQIQIEWTFFYQELLLKSNQGNQGYSGKKKLKVIKEI